MQGSIFHLRRSGLTFLLTLAVLILSNDISAQDPGVPDTLRFEYDSLIVGRSMPIKLTVVNDQELGLISYGLILESLDSGFARFDSIVFINRMADPAVLNVRWVVPRGADGISPDSLVLVDYLLLANSLPIGNTPIAEIYLTGLQTGAMSIDSSFIPPGSIFVFQVYGGPDFKPQFAAANVPIVGGTFAPELIFEATEFKGTGGGAISFDVDAVSPDEIPVSISLSNFENFDNASISPTFTPTFSFESESDSYLFSWNSSGADVGIWRATITACDTLNMCSVGEVIIQVVTDENFLIELESIESPDFCQPTVIAAGNFDSDLNPEVVATGLGYSQPTIFAIYDNYGNNSFTEVFSQNTPQRHRRGLVLCYLNSDDNLDALQFYHEGDVAAILASHGDGNAGFGAPIISELSTDWAIFAKLCNFNGDEYLDYAVGGKNNLRIYGGSASSEFELLALFDVEDSMMTLSSADFNNDGYSDFAIGFRQGLKVYLADGTGGIELDSIYTQLFGSVNIEVTNQGSDFDGDNNFDLCVATPSVGDSSSELVIYLGNGDGSFEQNVILRVAGQVCANTPGDFNNDGLLDIAYLNSAYKTLGILFGNGDGTFTNELRFSIPKYDPVRLLATDADLDGDIDVIVGSTRIPDGSSLYLFENQSNPEFISQTSLAITGEDNAQLELVSPTLKKLNRISSSIPTADYYRRNSNLNAALDDYASLSLVESGEYMLKVTAEPSQPAGSPFSVEFERNGQQFRLAKNAPMNADKYEFGISFDGVNGSVPMCGSYGYVNPPLFAWPNKSSVQFRLATDLDFSNIILDTVITGANFQPISALPVTDTATYYWRVKPSGAGDYGPIYVFNLLAGGAACADIDGVAGTLNILDLTYIVNRIFRFGPPPPNAEGADLNNDGNVNILDLSFLVNYIFRQGPAPVCD